MPEFQRVIPMVNRAIEGLTILQGLRQPALSFLKSRFGSGAIPQIFPNILSCRHFRSSFAEFIFHHAIQVDEDLYLVFYSTNAGVRAAIADKPDGQFTAIPDFQLTVTEPWEEEGGKRSGAAFARVNK